MTTAADYQQLQAMRELPPLASCTGTRVLWSGAAVGIVCGCLLGMCTLLLKDLDAAERLKKAKALETVFATVMQNGHQLIGAERCTLYLYDEASHELWTKVSTGADVVVALTGRFRLGAAGRRRTPRMFAGTKV